MMKRIHYRKRNLIKACSLIAFACLLSIGGVYAQTGPGGDPDATNPDPIGSGGDGLGGETTNVPFDGGVSMLVAAGVGYGVKKVLDARKKGVEAESKEQAAV